MFYLTNKIIIICFALLSTSMESSKDSLAWLGHNKKGIPELRAALNNAKTSHEMLKIFPKIEARLQENQLGYDCWMMALQLREEGQDPLKILSFGKRALNIMLRNENNPDLGIHKCSMVIGCVLNLLGSACFQLNRYDESLSYLNWSDRNLSKLMLDNYDEDNFVLKGLHETQFELYKLKKFMGRRNEAVTHAKKVLEIREKIAEKDCIEIGRANKYVFDEYFEVGNYKEALPFALKALVIYKKHVANDSSELTMLRVSLGSLYSALGEYDKAFEKNQLYLSGLKSMGDTFNLLMAQLAGGQMLVDLGRYEEAIEIAKPVISQVETVGNQRDGAETARHPRIRGAASMVMAKALCGQEKFADARKYIKIALGIFQKIGFAPGDIACVLMDVANLYEKMKEYEAAISLVQKALNTPELPQDHLAKCSCRLFSLVSLSGTEENRLSSLEEVVESLKENFGPEHCHVGHVYVKLGHVYMELGRPEMAAELLVRAKNIFDASLGPYHLDSLIASQTLSVAYERMESYDLAIQIQEQVVEGFKGLGLSEQDRVNEAVQTLHRMKGGAIGEVPNKGVASVTADSKSGVSDDGKVI